MHLHEHPVAALDGARSLAERMVVVGALGQRCEIGHLLQRQLVKRLAEIVERGSSHAIGVHAEEDLVQIEFEDLVLGESLLDAAHEDRLLQLAVERALVGKEEVLCHLLGDGGSADDLALAGELDLDEADGGGRNVLPVEAAMFEEGLVFGRGEGVDQLLWHLVDRHEEAALLGIFGEHRTVGGIDARHHRRSVIGKLLVVRQILRGVPQHIAHARRPSDEKHETNRE